MTPACIAIDWGTSNRRGWALGPDGTVLERRADGQGLIAVNAGGGDFATSLRAFADGWLSGAPVIMAGMVGSRTGWREAPYLDIPAELDDLARNLVALPAIGASPLYIVPGLAKRGASPDVMRGEECQLLGARIAQQNRPRDGDGIFVLPGTHSKWILVADGRIVDFRTYMTGELFALLSRHGSLAQLIDGTGFDNAAFRRGLARSRESGMGGLTHHLFGVRALALFGELDPRNAAAYLSGLLIGHEMSDALPWARRRADATRIAAIGSGGLLEPYGVAAAEFGIHLDMLESDAILPAALFALASAAGLVESGRR